MQQIEEEELGRDLKASKATTLEEQAAWEESSYFVDLLGNFTNPYVSYIVECLI